MSEGTKIHSCSNQNPEEVPNNESTKRIEWNIENVSFNVQKMGHCLSSPYFGVRYQHELVEWRLHLYPRGKDNEHDVVLGIEKEESSMDECFNIKLSVLTGNKLLFKKKFIHEDIWSIEKLFKVNTLCNDLINDMLIIRCEISPVEDTEAEAMQEEDIVHIECLMADLLELYTSKECSDLILYVDDEEFHVHRCILSARWPNLIKYLQYNSYKDLPPRISVPGTSSAIMKDLISFVYSGKVDFTYTPEMLKAITRLKLSSLLTQLRDMPHSYTYRTIIDVDHKTVEWYIGDTSSWDESTMPFIRVLPIEGLLTLRQVVLVFSRVKNDNDDDLHVAFKLSDFNGQESVSLKCQMTLSNQDGDKIAFYEDCHLFESSGEWQFPHSIKKSQVLIEKDKDARCKQSLSIQLWISVGSESYSFDASHTELYMGPRLVDSRQLCVDLMNLYALPGYVYDMKIRTVDSTELYAHYVIFSTRWPEYGKAFALVVEKPGDYVLLTQLEAEVWDVLLDYIYGAYLGDLNPSQAEKLLEVNRVAKLPGKLAEKCIALSNGNIKKTTLI